MNVAKKKKGMTERAVDALREAWARMLPDVLETELACYDGRPPGPLRLKRAYVIDLVTAGGFVGGPPERLGGDPEAVVWLDGQAADVQDLVVRLAFDKPVYELD